MKKNFWNIFQTCESCRNAYNEIKRITSELNNTEYLPLPDDFHSELTDKLIKSGKKRNKSRIVKYSALAACAVLVFMTGAYMKRFVLHGFKRKVLHKVPIVQVLQKAAVCQEVQAAKCLRLPMSLMPTV